MNKKKQLEAKKLEIEHLDVATQEIIHRQHKSDQRMLFFSILSLSILLALGTFGIYKQNQIATQNKNHIDCIIKDLATPQKPGTQHKYIADLQTNCDIRFTQ